MGPQQPRKDFRNWGRRSQVEHPRTQSQSIQLKGEASSGTASEMLKSPGRCHVQRSRLSKKASHSARCARNVTSIAIPSRWTSTLARISFRLCILTIQEYHVIDLFGGTFVCASPGTTQHGPKQPSHCHRDLHHRHDNHSHQHRHQPCHYPRSSSSSSSSPSSSPPSPSATASSSQSSTPHHSCC